MTNALIKLTKTTIVPERPARAAVPYRPARPAYYETKTEHVCRLVTTTTGGSAPALVKTVIIDENGQAQIRYEQVPGTPGTTRTVRVCEDVVTTIYHPAQEEQKAQPPVSYRPPSVVHDYGLGWNAGARSINGLAGSGYAEFKIPSAVGVVVGFNGRDDDANYVEIKHGLYFARTSLRVYESGVEKFNAGSFVDTDLFRIERFGTLVTYSRNGTPIYTSDVPSVGPVFLDASLYSGGDIVDSPSLTNSAGGNAASSASMRPLGGIAADGDYSISRAEMLPLGGSANALRTRSNARLRPLTTLATNKVYGSSRNSLIPLDGQAVGGFLTPAYALSNGQFYPLASASNGLTGGIVTSNAIMVPVTGMATNKVYGEVRSIMPPMQGYAADIAFLQPPQNLPMPTVTGNGGATAAMALPMLTINARAVRNGLNAAELELPAITISGASGASAPMVVPAITLSASATTTLLGRAEISLPALTLNASGTVSLTARAELTLPSINLAGYAGALMSATVGGVQIEASGTTAIAGRAELTLPLFELDASATLENVGRAELTLPAIQSTPWAVAWMTLPGVTLTAIGEAVVAVTHEAYAVNLRTSTEAGGNEVTRYTDYPFERIVRWRGSYFGMAADGLYLLEGTTNDGEPIEWALQTATTDFGRAEKKNTASGYVGGRLGPAATFTVYTGEKSENAYPYTTPRGQTAKNHRQRFGRGLDARYYAFGLSGDGEFEMDDLDIEVVMRTRRI